MSTANESVSKYVDYLNFPVPFWKRPESPPRIWRVVEGRKTRADGRIPRFVIQEVPEDLENDVVDFMLKFFVTEEPVFADQGVADDPLAVREIQTMWRDALRQGVSVVALTENSDPTAKPVIAGVNILTITSAKDLAGLDLQQFFKFKSGVLKKSIGVLFKLHEECDIMEKYGVDKYISGFGLSVHPSLRGQGLGKELLQARADIGLAYQIPLSETIFTATASQILATRDGYEVLLEKKYSELLDDEGEIAFPGVTVESAKLMTKRF